MGLVINRALHIIIPMEEKLKLGVFRNLRSLGMTRQFTKKRTILFQGEIPRSAMVVMSGLVKIYGITTSGDQRTVTLLSAGDIFPTEYIFDNSRVSLYYYEAVTDCSIMTVPNCFIDCFLVLTFFFEGVT